MTLYLHSHSDARTDPWERELNILRNSRSRRGCSYRSCEKKKYLCGECTKKLICNAGDVGDRKVQFLGQFKPDPLSDSFRGDVILVGADLKQVQAHRFILVCQRFGFIVCFVISMKEAVTLEGAFTALLTQDRGTELQAGKSIVFEKMFADYSEMEEKTTGVVQITDVSSPLLRSMVQFCYSAQISFCEDASAEEVLNLAHKYQIDTLIDVCEEYLLVNLTGENVFEIGKVAFQYKLEALQKEAIRFLSENAAQVLEHMVMEANTDGKDE